MEIRPATERDLPALNDIYNREVLTSTSTFDTEPVSMAVRRDWFERHGGPRHPVVVAEREGRVLGWAALSPWSERCAYARAAEVSVYVASDVRRQGVGRALLLELIARARAAGVGVLLARVSLGEGAASSALHRAVGFTRIGVMRRVGEKFGRILDVDLLELHLDLADS